MWFARAHAETKKRYNVAWRSVRDLSRVGPGLLVEVVDERSRVLICLK